MRICWLVAMITLQALMPGCGKKKSQNAQGTPPASSDQTTITPTPAAVAFPDIAASIDAAFPKMKTLAASFDMADFTALNCDAYAPDMEKFACVQSYGGTFQRSFSFDPASISFNSFLIGAISQMIGSGDSALTIGTSATTLTLPFLKESGAPLSLAALRTFKLNTSKSITRTDPDTQQNVYVKITALTGGFTATAIAADISVGIYPNSSTAGDPSLFKKYIFFADISSGLKVHAVSYDYAVDLPSGAFLTDTDLNTDATPPGYQPGSPKRIDLTVDANHFINYRAGAYAVRSSGNAYYSLIMAGTLDRLLLRKRAYKNASSQVTLGEQFWLAKYDPATKLFTDLGLNDSDGSYVENITGHDNFDFSATESVGIGNSLGKVLTDNFPSIQMQAAAISYAVSGNMLNPLATTDLPPHMSTLATGWTL